MKNIIKNVNSDIFILILLFLLEKKPFSSAVLKLYSLKDNDISKKNNISKTPKSSKQVIASPTLTSRFISPKLKKKRSLNSGNVLQIYSGVCNKPVDNHREEKTNAEKRCFTLHQPDDTATARCSSLGRENLSWLFRV